MTLIRMLVTISGSIDGQPYAPAGECMAVADVAARDLIAAGYAVADRPIDPPQPAVVETATAAPAVETATTPAPRKRAPRKRAGSR